MMTSFWMGGRAAPSVTSALSSIVSAPLPGAHAPPASESLLAASIAFARVHVPFTRIVAAAAGHSQPRVRIRARLSNRENRGRHEGIGVLLSGPGMGRRGAYGGAQKDDSSLLRFS